MARKNKNAGGRRFDTRLTFKQLCKIIGIDVHQRIIMIRYLKGMRKGVDRKVTRKT